MGIFDMFFENLGEQDYNDNLQWVSMILGISCLAVALIIKCLANRLKKSRVQEQQGAEAQAIEAALPPVQGQINTELERFRTEQYLEEDRPKVGLPDSDLHPV
ncbi:hypothetical protein RLOatenuis_7870 [Rickettsiales bacterium]|nr:hypothetical protein RLOatenuis_7870 [Rickettsiales bacterium]